MLTVVTSFDERGWHEYGHHFVDSFAKHWPKSVDLVCYRKGGMTHGRAKMRDLMAVQPCIDFLHSHRDDPMANGRVRTAVWRNKEGAVGYSFRTDAVKFCHKVFAVADAAERIGSGLLCWIDADVVTTSDVPEGFVESLIGDAHVAYLGRHPIHSECGFLAFKLPEALPLIRRWVGYYKTDAVFRLAEWHDSFVFDRCREESPDVNFRSLTPPGMAGVHHIWTVTPLAVCMDHCKGERKKLGFSPEMRSRAVG